MTETVEPTATGRPRPAWSSVQALALFLLGLGPFLFLLAALIFGLSVGDFIGLLIVTTLVPWIASFLALKFGVWAKIVGIIAGLGAAFMLFWTSFGVTHVNSFFDFLPAVLVIPGALLSLIFGIAAIVAKSRGHWSPAPSERRTVRSIAGIVVVLAIVSGVLNLVARPNDSEGDATVKATDFEFEPNNVRVDKGGTILVDNDDPIFHTFNVKGTDIAQPLSAGAKKTVRIDLEPGEYIFYCEPHADADDPDLEEDMVGRLTVV